MTPWRRILFVIGVALLFALAEALGLILARASRCSAAVEAEKRGQLIRHLEEALSLADEIEDGQTGFLIERALDEARSRQFSPNPTCADGRPGSRKSSATVP
jgi:hypothetical protein